MLFWHGTIGVRLSGLPLQGYVRCALRCGGELMDGYTLTLVIIGAATVAWMFVRLVDKLDRPSK